MCDDAVAKELPNFVRPCLSKILLAIFGAFSETESTLLKLYKFDLSLL